MSDVAIVSSDDPEKDAEDLRKFAIGDERIKSGNCPNGCGGMIEVDSHNAECPKCHFAYFSAGGINFYYGRKSQ